MTRLQIIAPALLPLLLLAACSPADRLPVVRAEQGDLPLLAIESGEIQAVRSQLVRPPQEHDGDLVIVRLVPEGAVVAEGDTVVWLDPSGIERRLLAARDRLATLEAQRTGMIAAQQAQQQTLASRVETALLSRQQAELQLAKMGFESESRREDIRLSYQRALVSLEEARTRLASQAVLDSLDRAKSDLEIAAVRNECRNLERRIDAMAIRAPLSGLVVYQERRERDGRRSKPRVGDVIDVWQPLLSLPDLSQMKVRFFAHEVDRHRFATGQTVAVRLEAYPESVFSGVLTEIALLATEDDRDSGIRGFVVEALLAGSDPRLRPGMSAIVTVDLGMVADTVIVPRAALAEVDGEVVVFPRATWPRPTAVTLAAVTPLAAAVASGLAAGTELVLPQPRFPDGAGPLGAAASLLKGS